MALSMGMIGSATASSVNASLGRSRVIRGRRKSGKSAGGGGVRCSAYAVRGLTEQYKTLRLQPGASEMEVKRAFRRLALQYHPDVCKGSNCGVQFHQINEAYDNIISSLRHSKEPKQWDSGDDFCDDDESLRGMFDPSWELWEEWMGWEVAGIRDYSSHIDPYI